MAKEKPPKGGFFLTALIALVLHTGISQWFTRNSIFYPL
jgi:hypothetical protein